MDVQGFDACVREGLNAVRPFFKTGLAKYNVAPFDPFFAKEVSVSRGLPNLGFTLTLRNVTESGWTTSKVTKFVSDLPNHKVSYEYLTKTKLSFSLFSPFFFINNQRKF